MTLFHTLSSGLVYLRDPQTNEWSPGGSCGAIGDRSHWLTAAHCVPEGFTASVIRSGFVSHPVPVVEVIRHPTVDLAVLRVSLANDTAPMAMPENVYAPPPQQLSLGADFIGAAFPMAGEQPVDRVLKGHFQRIIWEYTPATRGAPYSAFEMSVPALRGSSGAVLAFAHTPKAAVAVVTENLASHITVSSFAEVEEDGKQYRELHQEVVSYGIALSLFSADEWLRGVLPS